MSNNDQANAEYHSADLNVPNLANSFPYRCFAVRKAAGGYTCWRMDLVTNEDRYRQQARRIQGVALASAQRFPALPAPPGSILWKTRAARKGADQFFTGSDPLPVWSPFYLDIDCDEDPKKSLHLARKAVEWFRQTLELPEPEVRVWFSGSKGFHVMVNPIALAITPEVDLTRRLMRPIALRLQQELTRQGAPELPPDLSAYSLPRLLRMPNEPNPKSGLFKVELRHTELFDRDMQELAELAREPRALEIPESSATPIARAAAWWAQECQQVEKHISFRKRATVITGIRPTVDAADHRFAMPSGAPPCIQQILKELAPPGTRNRRELQLACWTRASGNTLEQASQLLSGWSVRNRPEKSPQAATAEALSVLQTVWSRGYGFSCAAARSALQGNPPVCANCPFARQTRTVSALLVGHVEPNATHRISLEEAREQLYRLASIACG